MIGTSLQVDVLRVFDGDTFEARVRVWPGVDVTTGVRLRNVDTPELKARCPEERTKAEAARDALSRLLGAGEVRISDVGPDKYNGRVVAVVAARGTPDIGAALIAAGHGRAYTGGRREGWCG